MTAIDENQRLVAILRGITPDEVDPLVGTLIDSGFTAIEIPLNSPTPFESIARAVELSREHGGPDRLIGAGTVLTAEDVDRVKACGGNLIVSPNVDRAVLARALELGMYISLSGIATFKNAQALRQAIPMIPKDRLLVETDSPYLAPTPHRGKRCEPGFVYDTARAVAELRGEAFETLCAYTVENTRTIFAKMRAI